MHACAGQDPGFSNRGGVTSHTHIWAWLRFCIHYCNTLLLHRITGERVKKNTPGFESSDLIHLHPYLFHADIMHSKVMLCLSTEYQACSGLW